METPESTVARNVAELREQRGHTVRSLAAVLDERLGRKILASGITKIENHARGVDVGDLVALAIALGVNPNRLLLPVDDEGQERTSRNQGSASSPTCYAAWRSSPPLSCAAYRSG